MKEQKGIPRMTAKRIPWMTAVCTQRATETKLEVIRSSGRVFFWRMELTAQLRGVSENLKNKST